MQRKAELSRPTNEQIISQIHKKHAKPGNGTWKTTDAGGQLQKLACKMTDESKRRQAGRLIQPKTYRKVTKMKEKVLWKKKEHERKIYQETDI